MTIAGKIVTAVFKTKIAQKIVKPSTPNAAIAIATASCVSKDAINCYYYVTQSLKNEKIPEDKRKFVAGLDLANGILNVTVQSALAIGVTKASDWFSDKILIPKCFSKDTMKELQKIIKTKQPLENFMNNMATNKVIVKTGVGVISALIATQVIAKRIIVPLIATPMASYFKDKFEKNSKKSQNLPQDTVSFENNQISAKLNKDEKINKNQNLPKCFESFGK